MLVQGQASGRPRSWVQVISSQSEDPLGATVTLSALLGSNAQISEQIVDNNLLKRFLKLIEDNGPQPRLIQLFSSVCICAGQPITGNQEMVLRMLWLNKTSRAGALLRLVEWPKSDMPVKRYGPVQGPSKIIERRESLVDSKAPTLNFLGKTELEANENDFGSVFVYWSGSSEWVQGSSNLFWDWNGLGISDSVGTTTKEGLSQVPIEFLCYVLEPSRLCEPVTGQPYIVFNEETATELELKERQKFLRHLQLADYFVSQLQLLTNLAKGRSYNCIDWLTRDDGFSYTMLIGMAANPWLPYVVRSTVLYLILALYVDRYPQLSNSGRPSLPEVLWINSPEESANSATKKSQKVTSEANGVPTIQSICLDDKSALPRFSLSESHRYFDHTDPTLGIPNDFKFYLLRRISNDIIESFGGNMIMSNTDENSLAGAALGASSMLLAFGFQSTYTKLQHLLQPASGILDGRSDEVTSGRLFAPSSRRYKG